MRRGRARFPGSLLAVMTLLAGFAGTAEAIEVQNVAGTAGVRSWLAESRQLPIIALDFLFRGAGSVADPASREGLASFGAQMLLEGAGDLDATAFQERLSEIGVILYFDVDRDALIGHLEVASEHREKAFELLHLALTQPRFDDDAIERVRKSRTVELARREADPAYVAHRTWWRTVFPDHPYGRDPDGMLSSVAAITAADLRNAFMPHLTRASLVVAAAGAIDARELASILDQLFGELPAAATKETVSEPAFASAPPRIIRLQFPQSACVFGQPGVAPGSADYLPALVLNHVIGGGTLTSRLFVEMREKRGLVYSVRTNLETLPGADLLVGRFGTENPKVTAAIDVVKSEWQRAAKGDVSDEEVADAKEYLKGALPVSLNGTAAIAAKLLSVQRLGLDVEYITGWDALIDAVSPDDVRATARRVLRPEALTFAIAGNPEGY